MTFMNEADWDRAARLLIGIALLASGALIGDGVAKIVLVSFGALAVITGLAGYCPAYAACRLSTRKMTTTRVPFRW